MNTFTIQSITNGLLFMVIPLGASALLWLISQRRATYYQRKYRGRRLLWARWGSPLLISLLAILPFYYYLFWEPFYSMTISPDGEWTMAYYLPAREIVLEQDDVHAVTTEDDSLPWIIDNNRPRQRLVVTTSSGKQYRSALLLRDKAQSILDQLQILRN